ncbi:LOW QUALITY PROTEIN: uncharacterized protein [Lepeophtheirus salmonis]|uniref:LOW QUALITY PROTEIN: uncharacterized protein n=1 Tax=Lepeophtheirus salmonis TaxID=72036 RepID=UPI003AF3D320
MKQDSWVITYLSSVCSASVAEILVYPLDITKTRLQASPTRNIGFLQIVTHLTQSKGGFPSLYYGLSPALYRHAFYTGVAVRTYEYFRAKHIESGHSLQLHNRMTFAFISGGIAQFIANPFDLAKIQLQTSEDRPIGIISIWIGTVRNHGLGRTWRGSLPNVQRGALVCLGDITTYDQAKRLIVKHTSLTEDNFVTFTTCSFISGLVATILSCPADVIKTRLMCNRNWSTYTGVFDCATKIIQQEGISSLYKGFYPCWFRLGPWSMIFWATYERLRNISGSSAW